MNILVPVHHFTDDPTSGIETGQWNFIKHLALLGHNIFVITVSTRLIEETTESLKKKGIFLHRIYSFKSHGIGYTEGFMIFVYSFYLRIFYRFDWIFVIDEAKTPFSHFKLGARLASRILAPETGEAQKIFTTGDWAYDRQRKDVGMGWPGRRVPLFYKIVEFISAKIWYRFFPVTERGQNSDILFCEGKESLCYAREIGRKNPVYLPLGVEDYRFDVFKGDLIPTNDKFVYLFVGRILRSKGIYYLIEAFKRLAIQYSNLELWIIGASYGEYKEKLKDDSKGFEDRIHILGEKGRNEVIRHIKSCHVIIDPMIWANFSSIALEALYANKPLIGAKYGNTKDFVEDNVSGFLVDARNVNSLVEKMEYIYLNYNDAKKMANRGHEFVKKHLTWSRVAKIVSDNFELFDNPEKISRLNKKYEIYDY